MITLNISEEYTRKDIFDYFSVEGENFTLGSGTWGHHGTVNIKNTNDFVFIVTYDKKMPNHFFKEGINEKGILSWQTQPNQDFKNNHVKKWMNQKNNNSKIFLFLRVNEKDPITKKTNPYHIYLGNINYFNHNKVLQKPVFFEFSLEKWDLISHNIKERVIRKTTNLHEFIKLPQRVRSTSNKKFVAYSNDTEDNELIEIAKNNSSFFDIDDSWSYDTNFHLNTEFTIDLVFDGPGNKWKIVGSSSKGGDKGYSKAIMIKTWKLHLAFQEELNENTENIECYLIAKDVSQQTNNFCKKYGVKVLRVN